MNKILIWDFYRKHVETEEDNLQGMIKGKSVITECLENLRMLKAWEESTEINEKIRIALLKLRRRNIDL